MLNGVEICRAMDEKFRLIIPVEIIKTKRIEFICVLKKWIFITIIHRFRLKNGILSE